MDELQHYDLLAPIRRWLFACKVIFSLTFLLSLLVRLGLIAEHGFWVKPAAAHRKQQTRDRTSTGWDDPGDSGKPPDQFSDMGEWGSERNGGGGRARESRGSGASTPMGQQLPSMSYKHRGHRRVRTGSGGTLLSPDSFSKQQPADGPEWMMRSHNADLSWRSEVLAILQNFTGRTPGSFLELKDRYLAAHSSCSIYRSMQWGQLALSTGLWIEKSMVTRVTTVCCACFRFGSLDKKTPARVLKLEGSRKLVKYQYSRV